MGDDRLPSWVRNIAAEDLNFIRSFLLHSGSLKAMAGEYGVSYPTIRARLDQLIERLRGADRERVDPYRERMRALVAEGALSPRLARELIDLHKQHPANDEENEHG